MTNKAFKILILSCIAVICTWILAGCGGSGGSGRIQISLTDAPFDADQININIRSIDVHKAGGGWVNVKTYAEPLKVNLLDYASGNPPLLLVDAPLTSGHYTQIRLMLDSAEIVKGADRYDVDLRNVEQTGVKCIGEFTVEPGQLCAIILDFNAGRSFVNNPRGSSNFMLIPTLTMSPVNIAAKVIGKVEVKDQSGTSQPIPDDAVINVYTAGHIGEQEFLISAADIEPSDTDPLIGLFTISVIPQGNYDFQIVFNGTVVKEISGQAITPPETDLGTILVTLL